MLPRTPEIKISLSLWINKEKDKREISSTPLLITFSYRVIWYKLTGSFGWFPLSQVSYYNIFHGWW